MSFEDSWNSFIGELDGIRRDGIHLTLNGVSLISSIFAKSDLANQGSGQDRVVFLYSSPLTLQNYPPTLSTIEVISAPD